jgi:hypothetical protein
MVRRKNYVSGFGEKDPDANAFLKPDNTNPFEASASGVGYHGNRFDDDTGYKRGQQSMGGDEASFLKPSWTGDLPDVHDKLADIIDSDESMGSGNKITGGGGALSKGRGIGSGGPRFEPKTGKRTNDGF